MDEAVWVGLGAMISAVVTALGAVLYKLLRGRSAAARRDRRQKADDRDRIIDRLERHIARLEAQASEHTDAIRKLWEAESDCEIQLATLYGRLEHYHGLLVGAGQDPGPMPPRPERRRQPAHEAAEYAVRQAAHDSGLVRQMRENPTPLPPTRPASPPGGSQP